MGHYPEQNLSRKAHLKHPLWTIGSTALFNWRAVGFLNYSSLHCITWMELFDLWIHSCFGPLRWCIDSNIRSIILMLSTTHAAVDVASSIAHDPQLLDLCIPANVLYEPYDIRTICFIYNNAHNALIIQICSKSQCDSFRLLGFWPRFRYRKFQFIIQTFL